MKLSVKQRNLKVEAPKGKVTSNVLGILKERKSEIIKELKGVDRKFRFGKMASLYRDTKLPNMIRLTARIHFWGLILKDLCIMPI